MPLVLTTPETKSSTVASLRVDAFTLDHTRLELIAVYSSIAPDGTVVESGKTILFSTPELTEIIGDADALMVAGAKSYYAVTKRILYRALQRRQNLVGDIA